MKISAVIITFNEERNIKRCVDSLNEIADEIIIVDSFSTDRTKEIVQSFSEPIQFIENAFKGHIEQKNFAASQATCDYILSLDADEAVSEKMKEAILQVKNDNNPADAYLFNRKTNYCGKWICHGAWYPDTKLRLWKKGKAKWTGINPHDKCELIDKGKTIHLKGDILHYSFASFDELLKQQDYFSTLFAKDSIKKGKKPNSLKQLFSPSWRFFQDYFLRRGFLDGREGYEIAKVSAFYTFMKYTKMRHLYSHNQ